MSSDELVIATKKESITEAVKMITDLPILSHIPVINIMLDSLKTASSLYEYRVAHLVRIILSDVNKLSPDQWCNVLDELQDDDKKKRFGAVMYDILFETRRQSDAEFFSFLLYKKVIGEITTDELIQMKNMTEKLNDIFSLRTTLELVLINTNYSISQVENPDKYYSDIQELYRSGALVLTGESDSKEGRGIDYNPPIFHLSEMGEKFIIVLLDYLK